MANGLVVLDEIDKANTVGYSVLGPLYSLLEEHTAEHFVDQSLPDLMFDASHLRIIATANDLDEVPVPLRSRMLIFHIAQPSPAQLVSIAREILLELIRKMRVQFSAELPAVLDHRIADMSPRSIKLSMEIAFARAVGAGRGELNAEDWPTLRLDGHARHRRAPMGFTSN